MDEKQIRGIVHDLTKEDIAEFQSNPPRYTSVDQQLNQLHGMIEGIVDRISKLEEKNNA